YCGVIIGKDMIYRNGRVQFVPGAIAKSDKASGIKSAAPELAEKLIRNTYYVLLTRGMMGTYVYCEDPALREYLKSMVRNVEERKDLVYIPVVGEIAAGHEHYAEDEVLGKISVESKIIRPYQPGDFFFLRVSGNSMIGAGIKDGDTVLIRKMNDPKEEIHDGDIVACQIHGDRATLKSFYQTQNGIRLHPENPEFEDIFISNKEFMIGEARIIGKFVKI
ncbi:MAG: DUF2075 domain-containing protein, partial [Spirochaetales bacterium]|nr:DUF2075 domain-containing protein [Spirochaetales bacterium]